MTPEEKLQGEGFIEAVELSLADRLFFVETCLMNPPKPNAKLIAATLGYYATKKVEDE